ncbi:MAG TPA: hypothetical protein VHY56_13750, partial [Candidatus Binataceae bacterium]|nr:hypothetical protein [Candidatus Binataceae bacterium]
MNSHIQATVAVNVDDHAIRAAYLCSYGRWKTKPHSPEAGTTKKRAWLANQVVLHSPHLMLPYPKGHDGIAFRHPRE